MQAFDVGAAFAPPSLPVRVGGGKRNLFADESNHRGAQHGDKKLRAQKLDKVTPNSVRKTTGQLETVGTLADRFWQKTSKSGDGGCWLWHGGKADGGFGRFKIGDRKENAHRVAYILTHGSIPLGHVVAQTCRTPGCVNPAHLIVRTRSDAQRDSVRQGRHGRQTKPESYRNIDPATILRGERAPGAKLTRKQVLLIRESQGLPSYRSIANQFGISRGQVVSIIKRNTWKHL